MLQLIKCIAPLEILVTLCWTGMYGGPVSVRCYLPASLSIHDVCCAALAPRGRGTFGCHIYAGSKSKGLALTSSELGQTIGEAAIAGALVDGGELYIEWFG